MKSFGLRLVVALSFLLPYRLLPIAHPIGLTFLVALVAFGTAELVARARGLWSPILATLAVVLGGATWLLFRQPAPIDSYIEAGELLGHFGERVRVHGWVAAGSLLTSPGARRFVVESHGSTFPVIYAGPVPDGFRDKTEVVMSGVLRRDGVFEATELVAKCPSSYPQPRG